MLILSDVCSVCGFATALILKIIAFCKKHNLDERWIMVCAKFGTIVMANNDLARGGAGLMKHPIQSWKRLQKCPQILTSGAMTSQQWRQSMYRSIVYTTDPNISKTDHDIDNLFSGTVDVFSTRLENMFCPISALRYRGFSFWGFS